MHQKSMTVPLMNIIGFICPIGNETEIWIPAAPEIAYFDKWKSYPPGKFLRKAVSTASYRFFHTQHSRRTIMMTLLLPRGQFLTMGFVRCVRWGYALLLDAFQAGTACAACRARASFVSWCACCLLNAFFVLANFPWMAIRLSTAFSSRTCKWRGHPSIKFSWSLSRLQATQLAK